MEPDINSELRFLNEYGTDQKGMTWEQYLAMRKNHVFEDRIEASRRLLSDRSRTPPRVILRRVRWDNDLKRQAEGLIPNISHLPLMADLYWKNRRKAKHVIRTPRTAY